MKLKDLPQAIYTTLKPGTNHSLTKEALAQSAFNIAAHFTASIEQLVDGRERTPGHLFASELGKCNREVWFNTHLPYTSRLVPDGPAQYKFLYGDIIEEVTLTLARAAGYTVEHQQAVVEFKNDEGSVRGRIDAMINGVIIDVKSASPYAFNRYKKDGLTSLNDAFGYRHQLQFYNVFHDLKTDYRGLDPSNEPYFIFVNKVLGDIMMLPLEDMMDPILFKNLVAQKIIINKAKTAPPIPSYLVDVPGPIKGSKVLNKTCSYCAHKYNCSPTIRGFAYASGPVYYTNGPYPKGVPEITEGVNLGTAESKYYL